MTEHTSDGLVEKVNDQVLVQIPAALKAQVDAIRALKATDAKALADELAKRLKE